MINCICIIQSQPIDAICAFDTTISVGRGDSKVGLLDQQTLCLPEWVVYIFIG